MNISKISVNNYHSFGLSLDVLTQKRIHEAKVNFKKEAEGKVYYRPLAILEESVRTIEEICPGKRLETVEVSKYGINYSVSCPGESNNEPVDFFVDAYDFCFAKLASKLKKLHGQGVI
jgi:hypothetical protein